MLTAIGKTFFVIFVDLNYGLSFMINPVDEMYF